MRFGRVVFYGTIAAGIGIAASNLGILDGTAAAALAPFLAGALAGADKYIRAQQEELGPDNEPLDTLTVINGELIIGSKETIIGS